jgi:hypothetical protein
MAGLHLDPWEEFVLVNSLGERDDGKWAAWRVGLVVPRQNGKGAVLEARELAGLFLFGEQLLIHSAHEQKTSSEHFRRLLNLIEGVPEFSRRVTKAPQGKGSEAIHLRGGQRIMFATRTGGGGRGLTGDFVGLDEAMILPESAIAALIPTMAAKTMEGNPQLWYAGSAVDQEDNSNGVVLARLRRDGLAGADDLAYFEWSIEGDIPDALTDSQLVDPEMWAEANPGLGIRISPEHVGKERFALGARKFAVERLGVGDWPDPDGHQVIDLDLYRSLLEEGSQPSGPVCFVADVAPDRSRGSISVAGIRADGNVHIEVVDRKGGTNWIAPRLKELTGRHDCLTPLIDGAGPGASILPDLERLQVKVDTVTAGEMGQACGAFYDAVHQREVRHLGQPELEDALKGAAQRPLGDAWAWSRKNSSVDISPLVACTLAVWGVRKDQVVVPMIGVVGR